MTAPTVELVVTDLGAGLSRIDCPGCGQTSRAVGGKRAIDAKAAEHRCGGDHWHLAGEIAPAPEGSPTNNHTPS